MRLMAAAGLAFALAACGGDGGELVASNSQLSTAQIDAALGPANQSVEDAIVADGRQDEGNMSANAAGPANAAADEEEVEQ